jgi:putative nucleotidyltransferase with HDIG domain
MALVPWASDLARSLLAEPLPRRWAHTQGVARQARTLIPILGDDADLLEAAAWLHDIGYSPTLIDTGFHPLDGARYLRDHHADPRLCNLVAHHSCAIIEAQERDLASDLNAEFAIAGLDDLSRALIYCDMTTGPNGQPVVVDDRIAEILARYGVDDPVTRSVQRAAPTLVDAVRTIAFDLAARQLNARGAMNSPAQCKLEDGQVN